jgi:hypothetical protein
MIQIVLAELLAPAAPEAFRPLRALPFSTYSKAPAISINFAASAALLALVMMAAPFILGSLYWLNFLLRQLL